MTQVNHAGIKRCSCPDHEGANPIATSEFGPSSKGRNGLASWCRACRARSERDKRRARGLMNADKLKPCLVCGGPTASALGVCRQTRACENEYCRLTRQKHPDRRREIVRRYRGKLQKPAPRKTVSEMFPFTGPSVYAVRFPSPGVLKIGFTVSRYDFVGVARGRAKRRGWKTDGAACIWKQPGDTRTEAWMQATLSFRWRPAFDQQHNRICEWFQVPCLTEDEVVAMLNEVYGMVPPDLVSESREIGALF